MVYCDPVERWPKNVSHGCSVAASAGITLLSGAFTAHPPNMPAGGGSQSSRFCLVVAAVSSDRLRMVSGWMVQRRCDTKRQSPLQCLSREV